MIEMGTKRREPAKEIADIRSRLDHLQSRIGGEDGDAGAIGQVEPRLGIEQISREPPGPLASEPPGGTPLRIEVEKGDAVAALLREIPGEVGGEKGLADPRSEEHTSELQSLMRISYAVFCLQKKKHQ